MSVTSCKRPSATSGEGVPLARVYDRYLYSGDLGEIVPPGTSKKDSVNIVKGYVENWVRQQVVLKRAEDNLDDERKDVENRLEEYRNSLITYIYERELIMQKLDTSVSDDEIEKYYAEHPDNFQLKNNIINVNYFLLPLSSPKIQKARTWFRSAQEKDRKSLESYCYQFATDYYFNDSDWMLFDDLIKKVPIRTYDQEHFLKNNRKIEIADSAGMWFVDIKGFKIKESPSPLSFERDNIRNLILNKRKLDLISDMEKDAYQDAHKENQIELWISNP